MTRRLVLMRHGKSGYPPGVPDHDRPLAERGRREARLAGEWMADDGLDIGAVLCSTATRTRETLQRTEIDAPTTYVDDIYGGWPVDIFEALRTYIDDDTDTVLVVGHDPGMPSTALALDPEGEIDRFPTSAYAIVEISSTWSQIGLAPDPDAHLVAVRVPRD